MRQDHHAGAIRCNAFFLSSNLIDVISALLLCSNSFSPFSLLLYILIEITNINTTPFFEKAFAQFFNPSYQNFVSIDEQSPNKRHYTTETLQIVVLLLLIKSLMTHTVEQYSFHKISPKPAIRLLNSTSTNYIFLSETDRYS